MKNYKAIIYDIDGTLLNTVDQNMYPLIRIIKEELGEDWTYEQVVPFTAQPGTKTIAELGIADVEASTPGGSAMSTNTAPVPKPTTASPSFWRASGSWG